MYSPLELQTSREFPRLKHFRLPMFRLIRKKIPGLSFIVLPRLKCVDFIFGLLAMKKSNMSIQPSKDVVVIGDILFSCESQPRRVSCCLVDSSKMHKILAKVARNKHAESELFLVSLHFAKELYSIKTDIGHAT